MKFTYLPKPEQMLDTAFNRARKKAANLKKTKSRQHNQREKHSVEVESAGEELGKRLYNAVKILPNFEKLPAIERELAETVIDLNELKRSLGQLTKVSVLVQKLAFQYSRRIKNSKKETDAKKIKKQFYGRASSMISSLEKSIKYYNKSGKKIKEGLPNFKKDCKNIILAGFPNTGKTTLLKRLTGSKAEIAAYPFTTKGINLGYFKKNYLNYQVIDTPGLLDRPLKNRNLIEKKAILALKHLNGTLVFLIDPTKHSGYTLKEQISLLKDIKKEFDGDTIIVLNKCDVVKEKEQKIALKELKKIGFEIIIEGENIQPGLIQQL